MSSNDDTLSLFTTSYLPEIHSECGEILNSFDFKEHISKCKTNFKTLLSLMQKSKFSSISPIPEKVVIFAVLLCGEHSNSNIWTDAECIKYAERLLKLILDESEADTVLSLMLKYKIQSFLHALNPKILKTTWKNYPAAILCFKWLIFNIKCPYFEDVLSFVLPTCLLLIDDHELSNKVQGLQCLTHLAKNTSFSDLEQFGRRSLIYNALEHMIYLREHEIIRPLAMCLAALFCKTDSSCLSTDAQWNHIDDVLNVWLPSMDLEQSLALREAYIDSLYDLMQVMGLPVVRWSDKLLDIFTEYTLTKHTQHKALKALVSFLLIAWPRIHLYCEEVFTILMKNAIDLTHKDLTVQDKQSLQLVKKGFLTLEELSNSKYISIVQQIEDNEDLRNIYNNCTSKNHE